MGVAQFENHPGPVENRKLNDIYTTLNELVSELKYSIERKLCQYGRFSDGQLGCLNELRPHMNIQPLPPTAYDIPEMYNGTCNRVFCPFDPSLGTQVRHGHPSLLPRTCGRLTRCNMTCNEDNNPLGYLVRTQLAHKDLLPFLFPACRVLKLWRMFLSCL